MILIPFLVFPFLSSCAVLSLFLEEARRRRREREREEEAGKQVYEEFNEKERKKC